MQGNDSEGIWETGSSPFTHTTPAIKGSVTPAQASDHIGIMSSNRTFLDPKTSVALHNAAERQVDVASILIEAAVELRNAGGPQSKAAAKRLAEKLDVAANALDRSSKITKLCTDKYTGFAVSRGKTRRP